MWRASSYLTGSSIFKSEKETELNGTDDRESIEFGKQSTQTQPVRGAHAWCLIKAFATQHPNLTRAVTPN